jgi:hypothetical protein
MCLSDRLDDREPEPAAVGPGGVGTTEALECTREEPIGETGSFVEHVQLEGAVAPGRP